MAGPPRPGGGHAAAAPTAGVGGLEEFRTRMAQRLRQSLTDPALRHAFANSADLAAAAAAAGSLAEFAASASPPKDRGQPPRPELQQQASNMARAAEALAAVVAAAAAASASTLQQAQAQAQQQQRAAPPAALLGGSPSPADGSRRHAASPSAPAPGRSGTARPSSPADATLLGPGSANASSSTASPTPSRRPGGKYGTAGGSGQRSPSPTGPGRGGDPSPARAPASPSAAAALALGGHGLRRSRPPDYYTHKWPAQIPQTRNLGRAGRRAVYVAALNPEPIVLRGGGLGDRSQSSEDGDGDADPGAGAGRPAAAPARAAGGRASGSEPPSPESPSERRSEPTAVAVLSREAPPPAAPALVPACSSTAVPAAESQEAAGRVSSTPELTVCSIATPTNPTPATTERSEVSSQLLLHQRLQETRERLAALEAEQRLLIDSSLGALVKAATGHGPGPSPAGAGPAAAAALLAASRGRALGLARSPRGQPSSVPEPGLGLQRAVSAPGPLSTLEEENRQLREAVAVVERRNAELARRREAAEARSRCLEEENRRAAEVVLLDLKNVGAEAVLRRYGMAHSRLVGHATATTCSSPARVPPRPASVGAVSPASACSTSAVVPAGRGTRAEAKRHLLLLSAEADKRLQDLLARRRDLEARVLPVEQTPAGGSVEEALPN